MRLNNFKFIRNDELTDPVILGYSEKTYEILLFIPLMLAIKHSSRAKEVFPIGNGVSAIGSEPIEVYLA